MSRRAATLESGDPLRQWNLSPDAAAGEVFHKNDERKHHARSIRVRALAAGGDVYSILTASCVSLAEEFRHASKRMLAFILKWVGKTRKPDAGAYGEKLAAKWLVEQRSFTIVARNWRSPKDRRDEIDLVARDRDALVFIEVKARSADALVPGYHAVNARKKRALRRAIQAYLSQLKEKPWTFRFDVVEVMLPTTTCAPPTILHFENVALFSKHFRP
jgi:putative endonuclease